MTGMPFGLSTARLRLRRPRASDAASIAALAGDYDIARMTTRMPHPYAEDDALAFLERVELEDARTDVTWLLSDGDGAVGMLGFFSDGGPGPELGYWLGRPFWGRGYASEAVEAALRWADEAWRKRVVVAGHFTDNPSSGRVLVKSGFLYTGVVQPKFSVARGEPAPIRMMVRLA